MKRKFLLVRSWTRPENNQLSVFIVFLIPVDWKITSRVLKCWNVIVCHIKELHLKNFILLPNFRLMLFRKFKTFSLNFSWMRRSDWKLKFTTSLQAILIFAQKRCPLFFCSGGLGKGAHCEASHMSIINDKGEMDKIAVSKLWQLALSKND